MRMTILNPHSRGRALYPSTARSSTSLQAAVNRLQKRHAHPICACTALCPPPGKRRGSLRPRALKQRGSTCHCSFCWASTPAGARRRFLDLSVLPSHRKAHNPADPGRFMRAFDLALDWAMRNRWLRATISRCQFSETYRCAVLKASITRRPTLGPIRLPHRRAGLCA